jgi:hypothetical protein
MKLQQMTKNTATMGLLIVTTTTITSWTSVVFFRKPSLEIDRNNSVTIMSPPKITFTRKKN